MRNVPLNLDLILYWHFLCGTCVAYSFNFHRIQMNTLLRTYWYKLSPCCEDVLFTILVVPFELEKLLISTFYFVAWRVAII